MYVYIDASGSDFQRERLTFAAVCLPQEANRHLPGFFFELKKEVYGVSEAAEVEPDRAMEIKSQKILNRNTLGELTSLVVSMKNLSLNKKGRTFRSSPFSLPILCRLLGYLVSEV